MIEWRHRSQEERVLLNPSFCSVLLWHGAYGYLTEKNEALSFEESFLILPFVLHRETRENLPRTISTSLPVWLEKNALARSKIITRARLLVPFTKEALLFGGLHGLIHFDNGKLYAIMRWQKNINIMLRSSSDEVRECAKRSEFIGKWFAQSGSASTTLAIIGVRP
jgi:hypothetical protein